MANGDTFPHKIDFFPTRTKKRLPVTSFFRTSYIFNTMWTCVGENKSEKLTQIPNFQS